MATTSLTSVGNSAGSPQLFGWTPAGPYSERISDASSWPPYTCATRVRSSWARVRERRLTPDMQQPYGGMWMHIRTLAPHEVQPSPEHPLHRCAL